jgi:hypothetical protein
LDGKLVRPDIIIHKRGSNNNNLVVFEIKKNVNSRRDYKKLKDFTCESCDYKYKLGIALRINTGDNSKPFVSKYFQNGRQLLSEDELQ